MSFLKLLRLLVKLNLRRLFDLPAVQDSAETREWCRALADAGDVLADLTVIEADDQAVAALRAIVDSDAAWEKIHQLLLAFVGERPPVVGDDRVNAVGAIVGFDPVLIFTIVQTLLAIWKWLKERRV